MKYFTQRLWLGFNSPRSKAAFETWDRRFKAYQKNLRAILPRINPRARQFFRNALILHDGTLMRFEVGDHVWETGVCDWDARKVAVRIVVQSDGDKGLYTIEYRQVTSVKLNFPGILELFPAGRFPNFGDWGYDELTLSRKGRFRHEVIFSSGATFEIEFGSLIFHKKRKRMGKRR